MLWFYTLLLGFSSHWFYVLAVFFFQLSVTWRATEQSPPALFVAAVLLGGMWRCIQGYHFSEIPRNLEMLGIWLKSGAGREFVYRGSRENLIVASQQSILPILYLYCNSFFVLDIHREFGLINVHLFNALLAISSGKVGDFFFCLESGNAAYK